MFSGKLTTPITTNSATQRYPLGYMVVTHDTQGEKWWVYVYNDEASTAWAQGNVIAIDSGDYAPFNGILAAASTPSHRVIGVAQHAITAAYYGFIQVKGWCEVKAGTGTIDAGEGLVVDTTDAGTAMEFGSIAEAMDTTSTEHGVAGPFGYASEDAAATALATCYINCM